uniref:EF-hand domain-containing protein n=1 Tax=Rhabditophanes sp. KR3021 TaxID=114890 RepID=A0AC35THA4_9BILA
MDNTKTESTQNNSKYGPSAEITDYAKKLMSTPQIQKLFTEHLIKAGFKSQVDEVQRDFISTRLNRGTGKIDIQDLTEFLKQKTVQLKNKKRCDEFHNILEASNANEAPAPFSGMYVPLNFNVVTQNEESGENTNFKTYLDKIKK